MARAYRFDPPIPARPPVRRPRLVEVLARRFESRVVVLVGGAGFGKSTLLAEAVRHNLEAPHGEDVWVGCEPADSDAEHLVAGLAAAMGVPAPTAASPEQLAKVIADQIWDRAPRQVAIVLDDVHEVAAGGSGAALVEHLAGSLPANGHLVLAGRSHPGLPLSRLRAHGRVVDIDEDDLAFDADELAEFGRLREIDPSSLEHAGGWPAMTELVVEADRSTIADFALEEVLHDRRPEDVAVVEAVAVLGSADDWLIDAVLGELPRRGRLAEVMTGVPLASRDESGRWTLHPLWAEVVAERIDDRRRHDLVRAAGRHLVERDPARAVGLLSATDDVDALRSAIRRLLATPWTRPDAVELEALHRALPGVARRTPEAALLLAASQTPHDPARALEILLGVARRVEEEGDVELCRMALEPLAVIGHRRQDLDVLLEVFGAAQRLSTVEGDVERLVVLGEALLADARGDAAEVLDRLDQLDLEALDRYWLAPVAWLRAQALLALGFPERAEPYSDQAVAGADDDLRGEVAMLRVNVLATLGRVDEALAVVDQALAWLDAGASVEAKAQAHGQAAQRLAMAGRVDRARAASDAARRLAGPDASAPVCANLLAARALVAIASGDESEAARLIERSLVDHPLGVGRHQYAERRRLALSYVLVPTAREFWDDAELGPAFVAARDLAAAVVALRDGDRQAGVDLDSSHWRVAPGVLPIRWHLELALSARSAGSPDASDDVSRLAPLHAGVLAEIAAGGRAPSARAAKDVLARLPAAPDQVLHITALGPLGLRRGDVDVESADWRRERVRHLLALLVVRRRISRDEAAVLLWPDLDAEAASRNLRVTLSYLQNVLEPDRRRESPSYFLHTDVGQLVLADVDMLDLDVDRFDRAVEAARSARRSGSPERELQASIEVAAAYGGELLAGLRADDWLLDERERHRRRFVEVAVRGGELALAAGDAARAVELAERAIAAETWSEAARRLLAAALVEQDDRAGARRALVACAAMLDELGVEPDDETVMLGRRIGGVEWS